jgi:hypothetical protein
MEILNEKAERLQAKKEVEIFKEIEERVKKEIKCNLTSPITQQPPNPQSSAPTAALTNGQRESRFSAVGSIIDRSNFEGMDYQI